MLIAHRLMDINEEYQEQSLIEHTFNVAELSLDKSKPYSLGSTSFLIGLLHDAGKSDKIFQQYIRQQTVGRVNHSSAGAKWILSNNIKVPKKLEESFQIYTEIIAYIISAHHGVYDLFDGSESKLFKRINYDTEKKYNYPNEVKPFIEKVVENEVKTRYGINLDTILKEGFKEFLRFVRNNQGLKPKSFYYRISMLNRYLLAVLKEADIFDTITWHLNDKKSYQTHNMHQLKKYWRQSHQNIENEYEGFLLNSKINEVRTKLSDKLLNREKTINSGVYKLTMPTGSGKTLAVMRVVTKLAERLGKSHIIYTTSYLSVLGQNAKEIKKLINNNEIVLEHHSDIVREEYENEEDPFKKIRNDYLLDTWDAPIILTTLVQFFNTLTKNKASNLRRYANLANSIIIIDEVQSIPLKTIYNFNEQINFLAYHLNCVIILCTATQPQLDNNSLEVPIKYSENSNLVELTSDEYKAFIRAENIDLTNKGTARHSTEDLLQHISESIHSGKSSILIILNTKQAAKILYQAIKNSKIIKNMNLFYLTTNLCALHRAHRLNEIKEILEQKEPIIVVATQLIEAGINVDFEVVYRSMAGLDSLIQAEGK